MSWDREFEFPVPGMRTLRDAANYIMKLPKAEQAKKHWQTAAEAVLMAAEDRGPMMHAHIGISRRSSTTKFGSSTRTPKSIIGESGS